MGLTEKQQAWVHKNRHLSVKEIATKLKISSSEVEEFLKMPKKQTPMIFYFIMAMVPVLFFVLVEIGLRGIEYGYDSDVWVEITENEIGINPLIARRYFQSVSDLPTTIEDVFATNKNLQTYRVFVLGGSSAAGYPYMPLGSFSRYIRRRFEIVYPKLSIEVINISMTAVNSYTIRDLIPDVIKKNPDFILIYAGHNEYYGAYGVGSTESIGTSRRFINSMIYLNRFKTVILIRDVLNWAKGVFFKDVQMSGTLMSRMVKEQQITFNSNLYRIGLEQFDGNMRDVLRMVQRKKIPIILGTLVSNLRDQEPFVSIETDTLPAAESIYTNANFAYETGNFYRSDSLYRYAKDLDALRFRASEELNKIILQLGKEYKIPIARIDSAFKAESPHSIIGNSLMTDHLHPTLNGQKLIGKTFFEEMQRVKYLPVDDSTVLSSHAQDSLARITFYFSQLDSVIAQYKIKLLKNDWPYIDPSEKKPVTMLLHPKSFVDSIAYDVAVGRIKWEKGQRKVAEYYLKRKDYLFYRKQMDILISQYPGIIEYYNIVAGEFIKINDYYTAFDYVQKGYKMRPGAFSAKWLGNIFLYRNNPDSAIFYLGKSVNFNDNDAQIYYNLAGAYSYKNEYQKALDYVDKCLSINPYYQGAAVLKKSLQECLWNKKIRK